MEVCPQIADYTDWLRDRNIERHYYSLMRPGEGGARENGDQTLPDFGGKPNEMANG